MVLAAKANGYDYRGNYYEDHYVGCLSALSFVQDTHYAEQNLYQMQMSRLCIFGAAVIIWTSGIFKQKNY
jgi:hypothetical protein